MVFWNWKKILEEKDNIIEWHKKREQEYRSDLDQKNKLLLQYQAKEKEYLRNPDNTESFLELKQKVANYERREAEYIEELKNRQRLIEELKQKVKDYEQREEEYIAKLTSQQQLVEEFKQRAANYERNLNTIKTQFNSRPRQPAAIPVSDGHYKTMARIAQKQSGQQRPSAYPPKSGATMTPPPQGKNFHPSSSQTVQFNPFKRHGR